MEATGDGWRQFERYAERTAFSISSRMRPFMERAYLEPDDIQSMLMVKAWQVWKRCLGWDEEEARRYTKQAIWRAAADIKAVIRRQASAPVQADVPLEFLDTLGDDTVARYEAADTLRLIFESLEPDEIDILKTVALWRFTLPPDHERHGLSRRCWYLRLRSVRQKISGLM